MKKNFKLKFFLLCLAGGMLFALLFFLIVGHNLGYPWYFALISLGCGLVWAIIFYLVFYYFFIRPFSSLQ